MTGATTAVAKAGSGLGGAPLVACPLGWRPTILQVRLRRYRCIDCGRVWRQDTSAAAEPRSKLSRAALRWGLEGLVVQHLSMTRIAAGLGVAWNTANGAVLAEGQRPSSRTRIGSTASK